MDGPTNGNNGCAVRADGSDGNGSMERSDAVDFFAVLFLLIGHGAEDRRENHSGAVNKSQRLVEADGAVLGVVGDLRSEDSEVGSREIQPGRCAAECGVEIEIDV